METCMNSNVTYNCSGASPVFNVAQPSWCLESTTDGPSTTITDGPSTTITDGPSTTITDIITTLVSNATTSLLMNPSTSSKVPTTIVTEPTVTVTTETPEPTEPTTQYNDTCPPECPGDVQGVPWWVWCIVAVVVIAATTCIIWIIIVWYKKKKKNQCDCPAACELHYDDPQMTLQTQKSTVGLIGTDEPDGGGIKTNSKENETGSYKIVEIEKGEESKDGCYVEGKSAPIVLTTDL